MESNYKIWIYQKSIICDITMRFVSDEVVTVGEMWMLETLD